MTALLALLAMLVFLGLNLATAIDLKPGRSNQAVSVDAAGAAGAQIDMEHFNPSEIDGEIKSAQKYYKFLADSIRSYSKGKHEGRSHRELSDRGTPHAASLVEQSAEHQVSQYPPIYLQGYYAGWYNGFYAGLAPQKQPHSVAGIAAAGNAAAGSSSNKTNNGNQPLYPLIDIATAARTQSQVSAFNDYVYKYELSHNMTPTIVTGPPPSTQNPSTANVHYLLLYILLFSILGVALCIGIMGVVWVEREYFAKKKKNKQGQAQDPAMEGQQAQDLAAKDVSK